ncbi:TPA: hypothetical protein ACP2GU_001310 [Escherichia coli]|uniref:hypothetical protein n=1 Tax=Escherichia coli TaxID=562 RepID=UPI001106B0EE|nr:hypothetical protein [Escherichia coli]
MVEKTQFVVCRNMLRLAGELSIVRVLNDFQPLPILRQKISARRQKSPCANALLQVTNTI